MGFRTDRSAIKKAQDRGIKVTKQTVDGVAITTNQISGSLYVSGFVPAMGVGNARTICTTVDVPADYNSVLFGPITIDTSGVLTIGSGSVIVVKDIGEV